MVSAEGIAEGINSQDGLSWQCLKNTVLSEGVCAEGINSAGDSYVTKKITHVLVSIETLIGPSGGQYAAFGCIKTLNNCKDLGHIGLV